MNFPTFINKWIISNRLLRYTPFWWWYRLISHQGFRFDDYHLWKEFWSSLSGGWLDINYQWEFEAYWGKGAKPEIMYVSQEAYDKLQEMIAEPPDPKVVERFREILNKPAPWDE